MPRPSIRALTAAAAATLVAAGALLFGGTSASAFDAGPLVSVVNGNTQNVDGSNFDTVAVTAPAPCDAAATRHTVKITAVTAANPADQAAAGAWVGDLMYSPTGVGLPGPITNYASNGSWQQIADAFGQQLVPGEYRFVLQCQNNLGTTIYQQWNGGVVFSSPTAWRGFTGASPSTPTPTPTTPTPTPTTPAPTTPAPTTPAPTTPAPTTPAPTVPAPAVDRTAPVASLTGPARTTLLTSRAAVAWSGSDNVGVKSFDLRQRSATATTALGGYVQPAALQATTARSAAVPVPAGSLACFSVRARDAAGNTSAWSAERCTARPLDDRALVAAGKWAKATNKAAYAGTLRISKAKGATLTFTSAGTGRAALVVAKGKGFGKVGVRYNGKLVKTVDLAAKKASSKVVIALPRLAKAGTVQIKVVSAGKPVQVDGLLLSRL